MSSGTAVLSPVNVTVSATFSCGSCIGAKMRPPKQFSWIKMRPDLLVDAVPGGAPPGKVGRCPPVRLGDYAFIWIASGLPTIWTKYRRHTNSAGVWLGVEVLATVIDDMGSLVLEIDSIEIIDSIPEDELQTGRQLHEHILDIRMAIEDPPWTVARHKISSASELTKLLTDLAVGAKRQQTFPLIHLECHGAKDHIKLLNGDRVTWPDISGPLRDLNRATRNQLVAVWAACEGIYSIMSMVGGITEGTSMRLIIGPGNEVKAGKLVDAMKLFYSTLTARPNVDAAVESAATIEPAIRLFKAEDAFTHAYIDLLRKTSANSKQEYIEELVTKAKNEPDLKDRPRIHRDVKRALKEINPATYFEQAKLTFFMLDQFPEVDEQLSFLTFEYVKDLAKI